MPMIYFAVINKKIIKVIIKAKESSITIIIDVNVGSFDGAVRTLFRVNAMLTSCFLHAVGDFPFLVAISVGYLGPFWVRI